MDEMSTKGLPGGLEGRSTQGRGKRLQFQEDALLKSASIGEWCRSIRGKCSKATIQLSIKDNLYSRLQIALDSPKKKSSVWHSERKRGLKGKCRSKIGKEPVNTALGGKKTHMSNYLLRTNSRGLCCKRSYSRKKGGCQNYWKPKI